MVKYNGVMYTYVHNLQGDIVAILDNTGAKVIEYKYDAWGKPLDVGGSMASSLGAFNPFRYRGYVYDQETGLYYLRSRYYFAEIQRFISEDTSICDAELGLNIFQYCSNNPIVNSDEEGRFHNHYRFHRAVQDAVAAKFMANGHIAFEEKAIYNVPYRRVAGTYTGRFDLLVSDTGEIYEIKKATLSFDLASNQVYRYT